MYLSLNGLDEDAEERFRRVRVCPPCTPKKCPENPVDVVSLSRDSHHAFLLLAFSKRYPCLRRVVGLFPTVCRFSTEKVGTF
jgi:hypothetical protein